MISSSSSAAAPTSYEPIYQPYITVLTEQVGGRAWMGSTLQSVAFLVAFWYWGPTNAEMFSVDGGLKLPPLIPWVILLIVSVGPWFAVKLVPAQHKLAMMFFGTLMLVIFWCLIGGFTIQHCIIHPRNKVLHPELHVAIPNHTDLINDNWVNASTVAVVCFSDAALLNRTNKVAKALYEDGMQSITHHRYPVWGVAFTNFWPPLQIAMAIVIYRMYWHDLHSYKMPSSTGLLLDLWDCIMMFEAFFDQNPYFWFEQGWLNPWLFLLIVGVAWSLTVGHLAFEFTGVLPKVIHEIVDDPEQSEPSRAPLIPKNDTQVPCVNRDGRCQCPRFAHNLGQACCSECSHTDGRHHTHECTRRWRVCQKQAPFNYRDTVKLLRAFNDRIPKGTTGKVIKFKDDGKIEVYLDGVNQQEWFEPDDLEQDITQSQLAKVRCLSLNVVFFLVRLYLRATTEYVTYMAMIKNVVMIFVMNKTAEEYLASQIKTLIGAATNDADIKKLEADNELMKTELEKILKGKKKAEEMAAREDYWSLAKLEAMHRSFEIIAEDCEQANKKVDVMSKQYTQWRQTFSRKSDDFRPELKSAANKALFDTLKDETLSEARNWAEEPLEDVKNDLAESLKFVHILKKLEKLDRPTYWDKGNQVWDSALVGDLKLDRKWLDRLKGK